MATAAEKKKAYEEWKERCRQVQAITDTSLLKSETPVERDMRIKRLLNNYAGCIHVATRSRQIDPP